MPKSDEEAPSPTLSCRLREGRSLLLALAHTMDTVDDALVARSLGGNRLEPDGLE